MKRMLAPMTVALSALAALDFAALDFAALAQEGTVSSGRDSSRENPAAILGLHTTSSGRRLGLFMACLLLLPITGCGISSVTETAVPDLKSVTVSGSVYGGALPVNGAHVYLFAANTGGFAGSGIAASTTNASVSLLKSATGTAKDSSNNYYVTTDASGGFSLTGDYTACTTGQQLYLYASGGNAMGGDPTKTGGTNGTNSAIGMLAALGNCSSVTTSTVVHLSEMSTIAAAYALAGFATDATHIADDEAVTSNATQSIARTGMANAFLNVNNLVNPTTGVALSTTPGGNGTVPTDTLNTLANILAGCVQSTGSSSTPCSDLFTFTGTSTTADTATAAINLAHNPTGVSGSSVSISKLFGDIEPQTAFTPNLSAAPNDYTIAISFGNAGSPSGIAVNSNGDVWTSDSSGTASHYVGTSAVYSGSVVAANNFNATRFNAIALDDAGNPIATASLADNGAQNTDLVEIPANGNAASTTNYGGSANATGVAVSGGVAFVSANAQSPVSMNTVSQTPYPTSGAQFVASYPSGAAIFPSDLSARGIAVDASTDVWVNITTGVGEFYGATFHYTHFLSASVSAPTAVAIGTSGSVWVVSSGNNSLVEFTGSGTSYTAQSPFTGGGLNTPDSIAMDGAGNVWVSNKATSISKFTSAGVAVSPTTGFTGTAGATGGTTGPLTTPTGIAVDGSGNVWVSDSNNVTVMFVGLGTPVLTPLSLAGEDNKIATRP
jgi:hypothetical protein